MTSYPAYYRHSRFRKEQDRTYPSHSVCRRAGSQVPGSLKMVFFPDQSHQLLAQPLLVLHVRDVEDANGTG